MQSKREPRPVIVRASVVESLEGRRLLSSGALDMTFGTGGKETISGNAAKEAIQGDGKIVLAGSNSTGIFITRLLANGSIDKSFGPNGTGTETFRFATTKRDFDLVAGIAIQPDGKIVVAGTLADEMPFTHESIFVARFASNGALDSSFNGLGSLILPFSTASGDAMALQRDGKIVIGGSIPSSGFLDNDDNFLITRVNSDGTLDKSFGSSGKTTIEIGNDGEQVTAVAIDYNGTASTNSDFGRIVVNGISADSGQTTKERMGIARLNTNGKLDNSFAGDGRTELTIPNRPWAEATGVVIQPGGKVVVSGYAGSKDLSTDNDFVMARYLSNGTLDKTFGAAKTGIVDQDLGGTNDGANALVIGASQYLILGGPSNGKFALAAFTPDGILDSSFGTGGIVKTAFSTGVGLSSLALGPNDTILAIGDAGNQTALARYFDAVPKVSIFSITGSAKEQGQVPATFEVFRDAALPFATRVYFNVSGTAKLKTDYTGITLKQLVNSLAIVGATTVSGVQPAVRPPISTIPEIGYVDIPAGKQFADVTITPIDHGTTTNKTAVFTLQSNTLYDVNSSLGLNSTSITIIGDGAKPPPVTFENVKTSADAYVQDGADAAMNFGTAKTLQVKDSISAGSNRISYMKFNLSSIPDVASATLVMDGELNNTDMTNVLMQVFGVSNTAWSETGITWNNKPALGSSAVGSATLLNTTENEYTIDVTAYVRSQFVAGNKTVTLALKNPATSSPAGVFSSREGAASPYLIIIN